MPYYVSWMKEGRTRRFAFPHIDLETALGFAAEILLMDCGDVWVCDESGQLIADRDVVARYVEETEDN